MTSTPWKYEKNLPNRTNKDTRLFLLVGKKRTRLHPLQYAFVLSPGKYILAWIWVSIGAKFCNHDSFLSHCPYIGIGPDKPIEKEERLFWFGMLESSGHLGRARFPCPRGDGIGMGISSCHSILDFWVAESNCRTGPKWYVTYLLKRP